MTPLKICPSRKHLRSSRARLALETLEPRALLSAASLHAAEALHHFGLQSVFKNLPTHPVHNPLPPGYKLDGMSLTQWTDAYWRYSYGGQGSETVDHTLLMPLPNAPGDGTPASIDVTLQPDQSFILPLWAIIGTSYTTESGLRPDSFSDYPVSLFQTLDLKLTIDHQPVFDSKKNGKEVGKNTFMDYFVKGTFTPPIPLDFSGAPAPFNAINAATFFESITISHAPLTPGTHTIQLDVINTQPAWDVFTGQFDVTTEYHNTWNITVPKT